MNIRFVSWNINGVRAALKKGMFESLAPISPSVLSVQEIKASDDVIEQIAKHHPEYAISFHHAINRKGYSGVATFVRRDIVEVVDTGYETEVSLCHVRNENKACSSLTLKKSISGVDNSEFDIEGRLVTSFFAVPAHHALFPGIVLMNGYHPQGGRGPHRIRYKIAFYAAVLAKAKEYTAHGWHVILCGDFNTTVTDIDLARPKENRHTTGCLPEEREALQTFFDAGYVDSFRYFYPNKEGVYTYWDQITRARERNVGWRIDYFLVQTTLLPYIKDAYIWMEIHGSDHCPVGIDIDI